jgi:hypothetical protein
MTCEECRQDFQPSRVYSPTAPNAPRFCSGRCRGRGYRKAKEDAIEQDLARAEAAIKRARQTLRGVKNEIHQPRSDDA